MILRQAQDRSDIELAQELATEAGRLLLDLRLGGASGAEGDHQANVMILERLARARPDDAFLSEETLCEGTRLAASRVWIIDPLDGTREFAEGRDDWAVHVGLAVDGVAVTGAVALPARDECFTSDAPLSLHPPATPPRMVVSRTRPAREAVAVAEHLGATLIPMGSAGAKAMAVLRGEADIYLHSGGQYEWDNCAPVAVVQAAGLHVSRIDGAPLRYNNADPYMPDLLICHPALAERVLQIVAVSLE